MFPPKNQSGPEKAGIKTGTGSKAPFPMRTIPNRKPNYNPDFSWIVFKIPNPAQYVVPISEELKNR